MPLVRTKKAYTSAYSVKVHFVIIKIINNEKTKKWWRKSMSFSENQYKNCNEGYRKQSLYERMQLKMSSTKND